MITSSRSAWARSALGGYPVLLQRRGALRLVPPDDLPSGWHYPAQNHFATGRRILTTREFVSREAMPLLTRAEKIATPRAPPRCGRGAVQPRQPTARLAPRFRARNR